MKPLLLALCAISGMCMTSEAGAHSASTGFLTIEVEDSVVRGAIELAVRDVEVAVGLDDDGDHQVTWHELRSGREKLQRYLQSRLTLVRGPKACALQFGELKVTNRVDGNYAWLAFTARCTSLAPQLTIDYRVLAEVDSSHRSLLNLTATTDKQLAITQSAVLGAEQGARTVMLGQPSRLSTFLDYLKSGIWHIWSGIDHLLFLISLLLPAVLMRREKHWQPVAAATPAFINIVKVVSAFTIAHSITLSLAAFDVIRLPSRLTESIIAFSILVAALNNIFPRVVAGRWRLAFVFGLLHGFGFASVLADMGLPQGARVLSLVAFNLGVEVGQLAVVLAVMPLAYALRDRMFYRRLVMPWGSAVIAVLALVWLIQRLHG